MRNAVKLGSEKIEGKGMSLSQPVSGKSHMLVTLFFQHSRFCQKKKSILGWMAYNNGEKTVQP